VTVANETSSATAVVLKLDDRGRALLSPAETAEALGVGISSVYKLMNNAELPFVRLLGRTKIPASDLAEFIGRKRDEKPGMRLTPWDRDGLAARKHWPRRLADEQDASTAPKRASRKAGR
jgi:excisionase family DNA binding protein